MTPQDPTSPHRRHALQALAATTAGLWLGSSAHAQPKENGGWLPTQNLTYVIGVAAGGSVDLYARGIKAALESLNLVNGHSVLPDNKPGAGGLLSLQQLQRNRGNAHHLGTFHTGSIAGQVAGMLKADIRDYVPVAMLVEETTLVAVPMDSPLKTAKDLINALKRTPESLKIAVAPAARPQHPPGHRQTAQTAGVDVAKLTVAPFRSSADSMSALLGGHVDIVSATAPTVVPSPGKWQGAHAGQRRTGARHRPTGQRTHLARIWRGLRLRQLQRCAAGPLASTRNRSASGKRRSSRWPNPPTGKRWWRKSGNKPHVQRLCGFAPLHARPN
jgi:tripartite-type tricarboxylate transporter receptor subunit TctC